MSSPLGDLLFDDTVLDKNYSHKIELVRRSGAATPNALSNVTCVYVNPETDQFLLTDYRLYDPDGNGKSKLDHVHEMFTNDVYQKQLPLPAVLIDSWYATKNLMLFIDYQSVDSLDWSPERTATR